MIYIFGEKIKKNVEKYGRNQESFPIDDIIVLFGSHKGVVK